MTGREPVHLLRRRSLWDGSYLMLCGARFRPGQAHYLRGVSPSCPACKAAEAAASKGWWW